MQKNIKNQIIEKNNYTAKLLNKLFAGRVSATKNLLQFLCFLYCLFPQDGEIYYTIKKIVEDELLCHKILAEDIVFCGDLPKYKYPDNMLFSVGDIEYLNSPRQMIEVAIENKQNYVIEIKNVLQKIRHRQICSDLCEILDINQKHIRILNECQKNKI